MTTAVTALEFQRRQDLQTCRYHVGHRLVLAIKDPISLEYFHFSGIEQQILEFLEQPKGMAQIVAFCQTLPETRGVTEADLNPFLMRMLTDGLIQTNRLGEGELLYRLSKRRAFNRRLGAGLSVLAIRLPGIDPTGLLRLLQPIGTLFFARLTIAMILILAAATGMFFLANADELAYRLPTLGVFLQGQNLVALVITIGIVKILHELGHALACQKFGGECHEIGIMLLAFFPCLYCNVSDAWMFPGKWQRLVVSSGGMLVELLLASLCGLAWFWTSPGMPNSILLNVAVTCSINTVLLNGNPLLRYDGYYVLSDLVNQPNLGSESRKALWAPLWQLLFRNASLKAFSWTRSPLLALYGLASVIYRWFIIVAILWSVYQITKINQVVLLGQVVVAWTVVSMALGPLFAIQRGLRSGSWRLLRPLGLLVAGLLLAVGGWLSLTYPVSFQQRFPVFVEPAEVKPVYASVSGVLVQAVPIGTPLQAGDVIAVLDNAELRLQSAELAGRITVVRQIIGDLKVRQVHDERVAQQITLQESLLADLLAQQQLVGERLGDLTLTAPIDGILFARSYRLGLQDESRQLNHWIGSPLDPGNSHCFIAEGDELGCVSSLTGQTAVCFVRQNQLAFVSVGQSVRLMLHQVQGRTLQGTIEAISPAQLEEIPDTLLVAEKLSASVNETGEPRPAEPTYRVRIQIEDAPYRLLNGSLGQASITVMNETLWQRLVRSINDNLTFKLELPTR